MFYQIRNTHGNIFYLILDQLYKVEHKGYYPFYCMPSCTNISFDDIISNALLNQDNYYIDLNFTMAEKREYINLLHNIPEQYCRDTSQLSKDELFPILRRPLVDLMYSVQEFANGENIDIDKINREALSVLGVLSKQVKNNILKYVNFYYFINSSTINCYKNRPTFNLTYSDIIELLGNHVFDELEKTLQFIELDSTKIDDLNYVFMNLCNLILYIPVIMYIYKTNELKKG